MKKISIPLLVILVLTACSSKSDGYELNGMIEGSLTDSTSIFLKTTDSLNQLIEIDTTQVIGGTFNFKGVVPEAQLYYVMVDGLRGNVPVILENGTISMKFQKDSLGYAKIKGTQQNDLFMDFLNGSREISEMGRSLQEDFRNASAKRDTASAEALREEFFELQNKSKNHNIDFAKEHPNALISVLILDTLFKTKGLPIEEIKAIYEALDPAIKNTKIGQNLGKALTNSKVTDIGSVAPDFSAPTPSGELLALNSVKGKVTLVDFWAAWCKPCRMENPNIVSVYEKYKDKGFQVLGVSLDAKAENWVKAIEDDKLEWNHVSNLKRFQDPLAKLYNVNAIPAAFLLDENGVIVAKNLRGKALEEKVAALLQ
jgi:peroxiredoxin